MQEGRGIQASQGVAGRMDILQEVLQVLVAGLAGLGVHREVEVFQERVVHLEEAGMRHEVVGNGHILEEGEVRRMVGIRDNHSKVVGLVGHLVHLVEVGTLDNHQEEDSRASSLGRVVDLLEVHLEVVGADQEERLGRLQEVVALEVHQGAVDVALGVVRLRVEGLQVEVGNALEGVLLEEGTVQEEVHQAVGSIRDSSREEVDNSHPEGRQEEVGKARVQEDS